MSTDNSNFSSTSGSVGSARNSHQKQYKAICEDLQARLRMALNQSTNHQKQIHSLEQQLFDQKDNVNQLEFEKHQLSSQINSLNEEISIQQTKIAFMKKEIDQKKEENQKLTNQVQDLETINQTIVTKFKSKSSQLKQLTQVFKENDYENTISNLTSKNEDLKAQLSKEKEENLTYQTQNKTLKSQNQIQTEKIERLKKKLQNFEINSKDVNQMSSKLSSLTQKLTDKTDEYKELLQKHSNSLRTIDELQSKLNDYQIIQQQNQQLKIRVDSFTSENKKLYEQIINIETIQNENDSLKGEIYSLQTQLKQIERLSNENNSLKMRINDLEFQIQQKVAKEKIEIIKSDDDYVNALRNEIKELKNEKQKANAIRIERDTLLQDVRILEEKVNRLRSIESENVELKLRIDTLTDEISSGKQRENRLNENIQCLMKDRQRLEIVRNKLLKIEDEVDDRQVKEQQLLYQVDFFKSQVREQKLQIDRYEEEIHSLQTELFKYKEKSAQFIAAEQRRSRHKSRINSHAQKIMHQLEKEKEKNMKAQSKIKNLEHTVNKYKVEFEMF